jgi:hypothetical protein
VDLHTAGSRSDHEASRRFDQHRPPSAEARLFANDAKRLILRAAPALQAAPDCEHPTCEQGPSPDLKTDPLEPASVGPERTLCSGALFLSPKRSMQDAEWRCVHADSFCVAEMPDISDFTDVIRG